MDNYVGKRLDGRYELSEIIGVGGMAVVYKAFDNVEARTVAVKILKEEFVNNEEFIRRFKNESKAIAVLSHPNIVKVFDVSFGQRLQYIVMEYIEGITLKQLIEQQGTLRWKDTLFYTVQILKALQHAHDCGIVHRDIKPQNIMVLADATIKVTDFGIARFARSEQQTLTDKAIGSVHYISPEQARGENTDEKSDLYSVGVMLYEMLTGQLPFQADSAVSVAIMQLQREPELPTTINGSIPAGLEQITMHAMQKVPADRYHSASEMLCDLEAFKRDPSAVFGYGYFVDNDPTRYVSDIEEKKPVVRKKAPWLPIISGITVTFVATLVILLAIYIPRMVGRNPDELCPNFVGLTWDDVQKSENFEKFELIQKRQSSDQPEGVVIGQSVPKDYKVKAGQKIILTVSSGKKKIKVPNVYGKNEEESRAIIEGEGFVFERVLSADNEVEEGLVIRTYPEFDTPFDEGATVKVYISTGKSEVMVKLPDCVDMKLDEAEKLLKSKGLVIGNISEEANLSKPAGIVLSQTPSSTGTKEVVMGSAVDLVVSKGANTVTVEIKLPNDYVFQKGYLSIWDGNTSIAMTNLLDFKNSDVYKFTFSTDKDVLNNCIIKISGEDKKFENYQEYSINCVDKTSTCHKTFDYSKSSE